MNKALIFAALSALSVDAASTYAQNRVA